MKKTIINLRTPQTYVQELFVPLFIVILFTVIGQADFLKESPPLDLLPESYEGMPQILYYNNKYTQNTNPQLSYLYGDDLEPFVTNNMMCSADGCEKNLWSKKEKIVIDEASVAST